MSPVFPFLRQWPVVCLVTDRRRLSGLTNEREPAERLVRLVGQAGRAGVDLVQIRERDMGGRALVDPSHGLRARLREARRARSGRRIAAG